MRRLIGEGWPDLELSDSESGLCPTRLALRENGGQGWRLKPGRSGWAGGCAGPLILANGPW